MKTRLLILAVIIIGAAIAAWLYAGTRPRLAPPTGEITLREKSELIRSLPALSSESESILSWFQQHQTGWTPSFVTYAPQTTISCDTFHINILEDAVVLNYRRKGPNMWNQLTRSLSPEEKEFWHHVIAQPHAP